MLLVNEELYSEEKVRHKLKLRLRKTSKEISELVNADDFPKVHLTLNKTRYWKKPEIESYLEGTRE